MLAGRHGPVGGVVDAAAARRTLREQIARLESELADAVTSSWPRTQVVQLDGGDGTPRLLGLAALAEQRDALVGAIAAVRRAADERGRGEEDARRLREHALLEPERYRWIRVRNEDVGEPGCKEWHARPRLGLLGMLMDWWCVRISSGCP
jgi:hypothetical protein